MSRGADTKANTMPWVRVLSSLLERGERRVALDALCKSSSACRSEFVVTNAAGAKSVSLFCQGALTQKRTLFCVGCGVLQRGDGEALECLRKLHDSLSCVGAPAIVRVDAAEHIAFQTASNGRGVLRGADTKANTCPRFEC